MIKIEYIRDSVCIGDDVNRGTYVITFKNKATLEDLMNNLYKGGSGNDWPLAYTGSSTFWNIESNIGKLGEVYIDEKDNWCINYKYPKDSLLKELGIEYIKGINKKEKR